MDLRSFSFRHPLLWMMSGSSSELRRLRAMLRSRRGSLRWTGRWIRFVVPAGMKDDDARPLVRTLLYQQSLSRGALLPSEERLFAELKRTVRAWQETVSSWQIVVAGEPSWTTEEASVWRRELDLWVGRWLYRLWRVGVLFNDLGLWLGYGVRRFRFALHEALSSQRGG
jgi:hypothetical protein